MRRASLIPEMQIMRLAAAVIVGVILMKDHGLVEMVLAILAVYCLLNALV